MASAKTNSFIRSRLKMRQLALLVHLDDERSVLRAAEAAGMTQPAASKLLREFEDALEAKLFERYARGIAPTWYGEILVRRARSILSEISLAQEEIAALKAGVSGQAAIGTVLNPGVNLVPAAVGLLKQRHPGMLVSIEVDFSKPLVEKLLQGDLDMLVARILDSRGAEELVFEPLADERHSVIAGAQHPLAGRRNVRLDDLVDQAWVLPPEGSVMRDRLIGLFLQRGLPVPSNIIETSSLPVITSLLRTTNMVTPLPEESVQHYIQSGVLSVLMPNLGLDIGLFGIITRRRHKLSPGGQLMLAALRETATKLYSTTGAAPVPTSVRK
jgi:DNA-binding transcriptional LysR family regulator